MLRAIVFASLSVLLLRLWSLQVFQHGRTGAAEGNRVREVVSPAPRGKIVDDQGKPLATNQTSLVITVDRSVLDRQTDSGQAVLTRLAAVLHRSVAELTEETRLCTATVGKPCWNGSPYQPIPVATKVTPEVALSVIEHPEPIPRSLRRYPGGARISRGFAGGSRGRLHRTGQPGSARRQESGLPANDLVGQAGLESSYDTSCAARAA